MCTTEASAQATAKVDVWLRAFIGDRHPEIPNYIRRADNGTYVIDAPKLPLPRTLPLGALTGTCFSTDSRNFSPDLNASARVGAYLRIIVEGRNISLSKIDAQPNVVVGATHNVDCKTGGELHPARTAPASDLRISEVRRLEFARIFSVRASSANPFYSLFGISTVPRIDFEVLFQYDVALRKIKLTGTYGYFPWFEAYYQVDGGPIQTIIKAQPHGDSTATSLFDAGTGFNMRNFTHMISTLR